MNNMNRGTNFWPGMTLGMIAGAVIYTMAQSDKRTVRRFFDKAAQGVENIREDMGM